MAFVTLKANYKVSASRAFGRNAPGPDARVNTPARPKGYVLAMSGYDTIGGVRYYRTENGVSWYTGTSLDKTSKSPSGGATKKNPAPGPATDVTIDGKDANEETATQSTGTVKISGVIHDTNSTKSRMLIRYSPVKNFTNYATVKGPYTANGKKGTATLTGLALNTLYYVRIYSQDSKGGALSEQFNAFSFWTNRFPNPPFLDSPAENSIIDTSAISTFLWRHDDPDESPQKRYQFRFRTARTPRVRAGAWHNLSGGSTQTRAFAPKTFKGNTAYEWTVRTQDNQDYWGAWAAPKSFYVTAPTSPPLLLSPTRDHGVAVDVAVTFTWQYRDPSATGPQQRADMRYRVIGTEYWNTRLGTPDDPGPLQQWTLNPNTLFAGQHYEWQIRTYDGNGDDSDWSESGTFWAINTPGYLNGDDPVIDLGVPAEGLGVGVNRVFIYDRGGEVYRGEITDTSSVMWSRKRDDISNSLIQVQGWDDNTGALLASIRCWMHEIVIFRDGERVWEGPISRITYTRDGVEIEGRDVMNYLYRRVMRQGYNDAYQIQGGTLVDGVLTGGIQVGLRTVVERAAFITQNALAYDDPNILPYLTRFDNDDDAKQSRVVPDFSRAAWEEVDDLAATAGLDYTVVGRRICYWDTHRMIGLLPEMQDGDFSESPVVTEYGMQTANFFAVTNNGGVYGTAERTDADGQPLYYGWVEQIASAYGETNATIDEAITPEARAELEQTLASQADRNIGGRYPTPLIVRVPDNSTLSPDTLVGINQLVPGVWIPLRAVGTLRQVTQMQKLDSVTVRQDSKGEQVQVVMSPAPGQGQDYDLESGEDV